MLDPFRGTAHHEHPLGVCWWEVDHGIGSCRKSCNHLHFGDHGYPKHGGLSLFEAQQSEEEGMISEDFRFEAIHFQGDDSQLSEEVQEIEIDTASRDSYGNGWTKAGWQRRKFKEYGFGDFRIEGRVFKQRIGFSFYVLGFRV